MTLSELRAQRKATQEKIDAILSKDEPTAEEVAQADELEVQFGELGTQIAAEEQRIAELADRRQRNIERQQELQKSAGRRVPASAAKPQVGNPRECFEDDPNKGFKSHREFLLSVMDAGRNYGQTDDKRLKFLATAGSDEQSSISDPYGGFLVPQGFSPDVMSVMAEADPIAAYTTKIPMTNAVVPINARVDKNHTSSVSGGLTVGRRAETQAATSSRMAFEQVTLNAQSLFGIAYASEELLARSPISFVAVLEAGFKDEFPAKLIDERLNGTGVGQFEGVINAPATVSVAKETGQAAATVMYENIIKMRSRCWGYNKAIWLYNQDCLPQLMTMVQVVGTGGVPVWQTSAREGEPDLLLGRPAFPTEYTQTLGTVGDIVLGNWSQYLEGTLQPMQSAESMHVRFENHERTFKFWLENDGRCWWRSALTPKRSSTTLSPFVTLATRA